MSMYSGELCAFDMDQGVVDEEGFLVLKSTMLHYESEYGRVRFFEADVEGEPRFFKQSIEILKAKFDPEIFDIVIVVNFIGIAEEKNPVVFTQAFENRDTFRGNVEQESIPGLIDHCVG